MDNSEPGSANVALVIVVMLLGAVLGAAVGGPVGLFVGAALAYVIMKLNSIDQRLKNAEDAQRSVMQRLQGLSTSEPPPPQPQGSSLPAPPERPRAPFDVPSVTNVAQPPPERPPERPRAPFDVPSVTSVAQPPTPAATQAAAPTAKTPLVEPLAPQTDDVHVRAASVSKSDPTPASKFLSWVMAGNVPVKVGVLVSLVGLGFLIQEANERGIIALTVEMGLIAAAAFGFVLLAIGWRLRSTQAIYGLSLQGGGIAALYLTTYAAFGVYDVIGLLPGGVAVIAITVGAGLLAVLQDARPLAVLGIIGGFLAPVLVFNQPEDHVALFGFYAVLSAAIVGVAWFKVWPELNLLGLGFTFGISALWLLDLYSTDDLASVQPLIAVLVLLYMAIPVLFAIRKIPNIEDPWFSPLVFGTPFAALGLQYLVIGHTEYGLSISALVLAVVQGVLSLIVYRLDRDQNELAAAYAGLALTFFAIAVPLGLNAHYTSTVWALQGTLLLWFGCRSERTLGVGAGLFLQLLAGVSFSLHLVQLEGSWYPTDTLPIVNEYFLGAAVLAVVGLVSSRLLYRDGDRLNFESTILPLVLAWGLGWWLLGGLLEIGSQLSSVRLPASLLFVVISFAAGFLLSTRLRWPELDTFGLGILPTMAAALVFSLVEQSHPFGVYGWLTWPVSLIALYGFLRLRESRFSPYMAVLHAGGYWLIAVLIGVEVYWQVDRFAVDFWPLIAACAALLSLGAGTLLGRRLLSWPIAEHWRSYLMYCATPVLVLLTPVVLITHLFWEADPSPLPYLPILNPLSLLAGLVVLVALKWKRLVVGFADRGFTELLATSWVPALAVFGLAAVTVETARSVHHWQDVPWEIESLTTSTTLHAALSVIWAVIGLAGMVAGVRLVERRVWGAGASLMAVVVIKLFLVDLSNLATVSRVVSFLGVGILLLIVGYLAPVPPETTPEATQETPRE